MTNTTLRVPKVANGSIKLDANPSSAEYGGFAGVTVTPGTNAWILNYPGDRVWDGPADSSFTYWLAHDDDYFYVGVDVKDDVVNSDDPNADFWKDDSIEIVIDALNDRLDVNTDSSNDKYGGHCYVNYEGRFSRWDDATGTINGQTWSSALNDWKYGPNDEVYGVGTNVSGGWKMEVRFKKTFFEDPAVTNRLDNGYVMGFNIGLDDDDKHGIGLNGDQTRTEDLEIQYFWANRERHKGLTPDAWALLTPEQQKDEAYLAENFPLTIDADGRLTHGGAGQIIFAAAAPPNPPELGQTVNGFQDDFTGATRDPKWVAVGPGGDRYVQADGVLKVFVTSGDPNHLLYMGPGASNTVHEVLARLRIVNFGTGDPARAGIAVNVSSNILTDTVANKNAWIGMNLEIRNHTEDTPTKHFKFLDDLRSWGPKAPTNTWTNNTWYWMRLKMELKADGTNTVFGKVWVADGVTPEPTNWLMKWVDSGVPKPHGGYAGITGCSSDGVGQIEVDYVLIKSAGLPSIKVDFASTAPGPNPPFFTGVTKKGTATVTTQVVVDWFGGGTLQSADAVIGPWTNLTTSLPPLTVPNTGASAKPQKFYKLQK